MQEQSFIPIYQRLKDFYKKKIISQRYVPGQRIDSINKMILRHSISRETAKLVLRQLIEEGLIISKQGKGSFVIPQSKSTNQWGMIIPFYSSNMEQLIHFLDFEAQKRGKQLTYFLGYNNPEEEMKLVGTMILEGYEAVIVVPNYDETLTAEFYRKLIYGNTTVILIDTTMAGSYFKYVIQSYDLGVKRAVDYLVSNTSGNLLMVKNDTWKGRNLLGELMEQTFRNIISNNYPNRCLHIVPQVKDLDRGFFKDNRIEGILTTADSDAIRVLGRLKMWGIKVPEQARLVNYGNTELTHFYDPPITVIDCLYEQMAQKAASLIEKGRDVGPFEQHVIQPELILRNT
jgi:DNA-binding LacI/PurR family transcriptional regulator